MHRSWQILLITLSISLGSSLKHRTIAEMFPVFSLAQTKHAEDIRQLRHKIVEYELQGRADLAIPLAEKVLKHQRQDEASKNIPPNDSQLLLALQDLARLYDSQKRFKDAEPLMLEYLALLRQMDRDITGFLSKLGDFYVVQGRYKAAESYYTENIAILRQALATANDLNTVKSNLATGLHNLGEVYQLQGQYSKAEPLYLEALDLTTEVFGQTDSSRAWSLTQLASLFQEQKLYTEAEPLYLEALKISQANADGARSNDKAITQVLEKSNFLASLYRDQGRFQEAESLYLKSITASHQNASQSPIFRFFLAWSLNELATVYTAQNRFEKAKPLYIEALEHFEQNFGPESLNVANSLVSFGTFYRKQENYPESKKHFQRALTIATGALGAEHPKTKKILIQLNSLPE